MGRGILKACSSSFVNAMALKKILRKIVGDAPSGPDSPASAGASASSHAGQPSTAATPDAYDLRNSADGSNAPDVDSHSIVRVEEVNNARFFVNDLFRRLYNGEDAPDFPRHFVAFYTARQPDFVVLGYIHYTAFEDSWLGGGMVIDNRAYRRLPPHHRAAIKRAGGVSEIMLRYTFDLLSDAPAIWGYVGDKRAATVDARAGGEHTDAKNVMVVWNKDLSDEEKAARLARVVAHGPF
jgi:hypothetical protein